MADRVLYIAGYGRSGSTVLGTVLGAHASAAHVGEISFLFDELQRPDRTCSCGQAYRECPLWSRVLREYGANTWSEASALTRSVEGISGLPALLDERLRKDRVAAYARLHGSLLARVRTTAGVDVIIDSSKSAWSSIGRYLALQRLTGQDVFVVHLIRSGQATMRSLLQTGSNWELEGRVGHRRHPELRAALGWTGINYLTERLAREMPSGRYLAVRYEDLVSRPAEVLSEIGRFTGLDFTSVIDQVLAGGEFDTGHVVGGNRLRFDGKVRLDARGGSGISRKRGTPMDGSLLLTAVGGWLERRYGYRA